MGNSLIVSDQLREHLKANLERETDQQLAARAGVSQSSISRFVNRGLTLRSDTIDKLALALGLGQRLTSRPRKKGR